MKKIKFIKEQISGRKAPRQTDPRIASSKYRDTAIALKGRAAALKELAEALPKQIRLLDAYSDLFNYTADELDRFHSNYPFAILTSPYLDQTPDDVNRSLLWTLPDTRDIQSTVTAASGAGTGSLNYFIPEITKAAAPADPYFDSLPVSFKQLQGSEELIPLLDQLDLTLGSTWIAAWENLSLKRFDSLKNASVNARTVVDRISWLPDYEHLKTLPWYIGDKENKPIRAVRYAWIRYGDDLPNLLKSDSREDLLWKSFGAAYSVLEKFIHTTSYDSMSASRVWTALVALENGLLQYLRDGMERLLLVNKDGGNY